MFQSIIVHQLPGILAELKLQLTLLVDSQLGSRVKNTGVLVLVGIVQIEFARRKVVRHALSVAVGLSEPDPALGCEPDSVPGGCLDQPDGGEINHWQGSERFVGKQESSEAGEAKELSDFLDNLPRLLKDDWETQWRVHEAESSSLGKAAVPRKVARVPLQEWQSHKKSPKFSVLQRVVKDLKRRAAKANEFSRGAKSRSWTPKDLHSPGHFEYCRLMDLVRVHPTGFSRITKSITIPFPEDLLDKVSEPVFVTAPAGHGKTSFCKWNTLNDIQRLIDKTGTISPIYVPLHRLSTIEVTSCEDAFFRGPGAMELVVLAQKRSQRVRLYLDGLDEVSTLERQEKLVLLASEIPTKYPYIQIVLTGRDYLSGTWLRWLSRIHLSELDERQVRTLVENWLDRDKALLTNFYDQLAKTPSLKPLMRVPLLGTLIIAVFKRMKSLPENKLKLYEAFTDLMCGGWDLAKNVRRDTKFGSNTKLSVLTRLAGQLHLNGRRDAQTTHIKNAVDQTAPALNTKWNELLNEILEDGLLIRAASGTFVFSHLSFQEYLTATELTDPQGNRSSQALKDFLRGDDRGREVLTFYLSLIKRPDETEAWIRKTAEQLAEKGADISERYGFLMQQLSSAWPGWSPRKGPLRVK